jgi:hypothetical protein
MTTKEEVLLTKYDLMYESRLSKTEEAMTHVIDTCKDVKYDLRWMFGILIGFNLGLLMVMAKGFKWLT